MATDSAFVLEVVDSGEPALVFEDEGVAITVFRSAYLASEAELSDGSSVEIEIVFDPELHRLVAQSVKIQRAGEGREVTARVLREVRVQEEIVRTAMGSMIQVHRGDSLEYPDGWIAATGEEELARIGPMTRAQRETAVQDAAIVYTLATLANWPPLQTVAEKLGVSASTANRLVTESRVRERLG